MVVIISVILGVSPSGPPDQVDSIYTPYWVFHDQWDGVVPYQANAYPLFEAARYNGIHWWHCIWMFC